MVEIEIDGKKIEAESGSMIIEAADRAGIHIPRFCYHHKLSIAANCRMCLVEVDGGRKPLPACATPITDGMKVHTQSEEALHSQKAVMEFLLINHPLDCPICDQGGECELQDVALGYGSDVSRFTERKRVVEDENLGSLIATDMTRCIHCTRCVRFGEEVAGLRELGATGRGEHMEIGVYIEQSLVSEVSGNVIDLCPVGALTSKPYRYTARAWELDQYSTIAPHDCLGTNIFVHTRRGEVMRVIPRDNEAINECWISDRDRFSYTGLHSPDRIMAPLIKRNGEWQEVDWRTAFDVVINGMRSVLETHGAQQIGVLSSCTATTEEQYLLQKLMRGIGCHNIDHRLRQTDFSDQAQFSAFPKLGINIADIDQQELVLLLGANINREQPLLSLRLRQTVANGGHVMSISSFDSQFNFDVCNKRVVAPQDFVNELAGIAKALLSMSSKSVPDGLKQFLQHITPTEQQRSIAGHFSRIQRGVVLLGALAINHPQASALRALSHMIASLSNVKVGYLTAGPNTAGAWLAGALPHRDAAGHAADGMGLAAGDMLEAKLKAYILYGVEPQLDCANPSQATQALKQAELVVALSPFGGKYLAEYADVILPITPFTETSGTFVNVEGQWQSFQGVAQPLGKARPGWKVLRVLANELHLDGFDYEGSHQVRDELKAKVDDMPKMVGDWIWPETIESAEQHSITRITEWSLYASDALVRRAECLQEAGSNEAVGVRMNRRLAESQQLVDGEEVAVRQQDGEAVLPVIVDERVPDNCVFVPAGHAVTASLGASFGEVELSKV